ncbi:hypothetical protein [Halanaerobium congolense]|uniref:hypothetical protein n=1 Tax=Halanaerobium congolense TaxID=54121 RepID=UPI0010609496|nr:hypothetical protein [Halanaerobium congolense]TDP11581.1 hypothetical protein C8C79_1349 [Halanaerobium congolense]
MKIGLVCPSNILYMPYVNNYLDILENIDVEYEIINWDRFNYDETKTISYKDKKIGHSRNFWDYYKYKNFLIKHLKNNNYNKLIVFGVQLTFFLNNYLLKNYKNKFIIDIRDYHKLIYFFRLNKLINYSFSTIISSPGYKNWLPESDKYLINHNTNSKSYDGINKFSFNKNEINISYIGSIRNYKINKKLITNLMNKFNFNLLYHGYGEDTDKLMKFVSRNEINNVTFTGKYVRKEEKTLYNKADFINILRNNKSINNRTALPNRLYNSVIYSKPIIALEGTQLADIITNYSLGLVVESLENIEGKILSYIDSFDINNYKKNRDMFLHKVIKENKLFKKKITEFVD